MSAGEARSHRIQNPDGSPKVLRLHIEIKDAAGATPSHPVLVQLALGGVSYGTLILDPNGTRIECSSAAFIWHDRDAQGVLIPNDEFEYRLGTFANIAGYIPDPNHTGQVLPVWGLTENLDVTITTLDQNNVPTPVATSFGVHPESGRPAQFVSRAALNNQPGDDVFRFWPDGIYGFVSSWVYNAYYLTDQRVNGVRSAKL